jgi:hypothetical protein
MSSIMDARSFLILMGARKVGNYLYAWGGDAGEEPGLDCSGFVCSILTETNRAWPGLYTGGRTTASALYKWFDERGLPDINKMSDLTPGSIVFYHNKSKPTSKIFHVALHVTNVPDIRLKQGLTNKFLSMPVGPVSFEAGGSGSDATTPRNALLKSATVRLTASDEHGRGVTWVAKDPFLLLERAAGGEIQPDHSATGEESLVEALAKEASATPANMRKAQAKVAATATSYNRQRELERLWSKNKLYKPLRNHPSDSSAFAILVAHYQRSNGFSSRDVDGKLGPGTYKHMKAQS